ncbi:MAG TPA: endonuclease SmrB [Buchnera sp. (in: enterobacteria)]|nr:endonuclease SmrB [Buchnera sp. (in: enterobacteria)]
MTKNSYIISTDQLLFNKFMTGTKKIIQDTIYHVQSSKKKKNIFLDKYIHEVDAHTHYFLSRKSNIIINDNPVCYIRNTINQIELKKLKTGKYYPDIILDLHGFTQYESRKALGKLISICHLKNFLCACVIHGHGKHILKKQIPMWLAQHPDIIAFHEAPKNFGSNAALLVLIENNF